MLPRPPLSSVAAASAGVPGLPWVFVSANSFLFGFLRLYGSYQEGIGEKTPIVTILSEAFQALTARQLVDRGGIIVCDIARPEDRLRDGLDGESRP
jgi:hypothetical protein